MIEEENLRGPPVFNDVPEREPGDESRALPRPFWVPPISHS